MPACGGVRQTRCLIDSWAGERYSLAPRSISTATRPAGSTGGPAGNAGAELPMSRGARGLERAAERGSVVVDSRNFRRDSTAQRVLCREHLFLTKIVGWRLPRVVMGAFPFAATMWDSANTVRIRSGRVGRPAWDWGLHPPLRPPRFAPISKSAATDQSPLALRRFATYIQRTVFSRTSVRMPSTGGHRVVGVERGPPVVRP